MRKLIDPKKSELVDGLLKSKESSLPESRPSDISIDDLLLKGLKSIYGIIRAIEVDVGTGAPSRNTVMNLKDCMAMLSDLKKKEQDLIDNLSDDQLEELSKK